MAGGRRDPEDLEREMRAHLAHEEDELRVTGVSADEAHRQAGARFGSLASAKERVAETSRFAWLVTLGQDLRYGVRLLIRRPAFSIAAALVLSLGIGATTALFSVVNGLFHRSLGVTEPERLFYFYTRNWSGQVGNAVEPRTREFFVEEARELADFSSHWIWSRVRIVVDNESSFVGAGVVESSFFTIAGVEMAAGRPFRPEDDDPGNPERSMVISHDLWTERFGGDDVVGRTVRLVTPNGDSVVYRVIGVAAQDFRGLSDPLTPLHCWVTGAQTFEWVRSSGVGNYGNGPMGRLKPGVSLDQLRSMIAARTPVIRQQLFDLFSARFRAANPDWPARESYQVHRVLDVQVPRDPTAWLVPPSVLVATGAVVAMVLVIATANVGGLLVARGIGRSSEIAVRRALGARGGQLAGHVLAETTVLAAVGGMAGAGVAAACVALFRAYSPSPLVAETVADWRVLVFAVAVSIGTGLLVGLMPALQALRVSVLESLGAGVVGSRRSVAGIGRWLLVPQVALALLLLLVAAVHVKAIATLEITDPGVRADHAEVIQVVRTEPMPRFGPSKAVEDVRRQQAEWWTRTWRFNYDLITKLEGARGIQAFGVTSSLPLGLRQNVTPLASENSGLRPEDGPVGAGIQVISSGYFDAIGTRLVAGRRFSSGDVTNSAPVAIVSEALARALWPEGTPLGKRLASPPEAGKETIWREVVGVVAEIDPIFKPRGQEPRLYVPLSQSVPLTNASVVIRTGENEPGILPDIRAAILGADATAEITSVRTLRQVLDELLYPRRLAATLLVAAGVTGLVLAAVGLYGVVSYSAAQRLRELGIRATLGASPRDLVRLLLREAVMVVSAGTVLGLTLAFTALRLTSRTYPDLPTLDAASFVLVPFLLFAIVLAACLIPARRVVASAPAHALRAE